MRKHVEHITMDELIEKMENVFRLASELNEKVGDGSMCGCSGHVGLQLSELQEKMETLRERINDTEYVLTRILESVPV